MTSPQAVSLLARESGEGRERSVSLAFAFKRTLSDDMVQHSSLLSAMSEGQTLGMAQLPFDAPAALDWLRLAARARCNLDSSKPVKLANALQVRSTETSK
jgi:hypothetical protein